MSTPRRQIVRPILTEVRHTDRHRRLQKLRMRLEQERAAFSRWMPRLKRSFHAVEKFQLRIARLERQITLLEE